MTPNSVKALAPTADPMPMNTGFSPKLPLHAEELGEGGLGGNCWC